jgi:HTH-type transcriptional regulator / antitoxin HipB
LYHPDSDPRALEILVDYPIKTLSQLRPILVGFRKKAGLTQEAVARRLGISQQSYAAFEANPEAASVERLFRVLRQFDVAISLGASERAASPAASAAPPARMQARAGRNETGAAVPRARRTGSKTREDW